MSGSAARVPTFLFVGVTTRQSAIVRVFPAWMAALGRPEVALEGVDLAIGARPEAYRAVVSRIKDDPRVLGALVTTHKLDLLAAARDLFDRLDPAAELLGEVSCVSTREGHLWGHAKDPATAGLALDAIVGPGHFARTGGELLCLGTGGAATALLLHLLERAGATDRPRRVIMTDRRPERLAEARRVAAARPSDVAVETVRVGTAADHDALLAALPPASVIANATGMGKDLPGSPVTGAAVFPLDGVAWDFNYRGAREFLAQARAQRASRRLRVEDGWTYFLHGWTQVIAEVLDVTIDAPAFARLARAAEAARGA